MTESNGGYQRRSCRGHYHGVLFIGDPHLASRVPGFRRDDYPTTILNKLRWCLDYARENELLPAILGDLFDRPRDNANRLMGELLELLGRQDVIAIYGNHDCRQNELTDDESFAVVLKAGSLHLVDESGPWRGVMNGRSVVVGGTSWGRWLPRSFELPAADVNEAGGIEQRDDEPADLRPLVFWMVHHDVILPGYEEQGHFPPRDIPGIDVIINGHIHRGLEDKQVGSTLWITPGAICRISRSEHSRVRVPSVLRVNIDGGAEGWSRETVVVPHEPYDAVFYEELPVEEIDTTESAFIAGLAELQARRTETGAGLTRFLEMNLGQFDERVAEEIRSLAREVTIDGSK